jgi:hypothetical protein
MYSSVGERGMLEKLGHPLRGSLEARESICTEQEQGHRTQGSQPCMPLRLRPLFGPSGRCARTSRSMGSSLSLST